jgi:hypothetical protein
MSADQLPPDFAPYHLVRLDTPRAQGAGRFYDLGICAASLDFIRRHCPEGEWGILSDGGLVDDTKIKRTPMRGLPVDLNFTSAPPFKLLRKAA